MKNLNFKKVLLGTLMLAFAFSMSNCKTHHHHSNGKRKSPPPGHVKKATGAKSAKNYAPGHRKKHK